MKKNFLSLTVSVAMAGSLLAGCSSSGGDSSGKVYWLNFKPEADEALQQIAKDYKEETGVEVKVVTAASGKYQETLTAEMDKSEAPTLFVVGNSAAVKTWGDYCYDLKDTSIYNELTTDDFTLYNGEEVASIGYCYETYGIIVNKTLLAEAGYKVEDITNFNTLKAVADDIHARAGELGFDAFTSSGMDD
ncbi:extracellular solute-binding protein, partial [Floccifex sp.]|uniref:extracellular solute-binding protein n=1 Tax=Floccifex sp. TaxID=2815810 RepID=UPI003F095248